jgi:hypothetical protein
MRYNLTHLSKSLSTNKITLIIKVELTLYEHDPTLYQMSLCMLAVKFYLSKIK